MIHHLSAKDIVTENFIKEQRFAAVQRWRDKLTSTPALATFMTGFDHLFSSAIDPCSYIFDDNTSCQELRFKKSSSYCAKHHSLCHQRTMPLNLKSILHTRPSVSQSPVLRLSRNLALEVYD